MSKHSITVIVGLLALTWSVSAYSCTNLLCNYCDYYGYCTSCVANAYISGSNCYCYSGYHQSYDTCVSSGLATWAYVLISIANVIFWIAIIVCIVRCIKRRRQGAQGRYNMIVEPAPIYGAAIAQNFINRANPAIPTNIAEANRTIPTGVPANPYMHNNPYSPPNPQPLLCSVCRQGPGDCQTSCGHPAHKTCLDRWPHPTCPTCGQMIPELRK